jgi:hypothetical protein
LGHLHTTKADGVAHEVELESVRTLQTRLDRIKKRHDELEPGTAFPPSPIVSTAEGLLTPLPDSLGSSLPRSRSTITMINDSPQRSAASNNKAERLLGLGLGANLGEKSDLTEGKKGKATSWLKKSFGGKQKDKERVRGAGSMSPSLNLDGSSPPVLSPALDQELKQTPKPSSETSRTSYSPLLPSPSMETETRSMSPIAARQPKPPLITTTSPTLSPPASPPNVKFEFELPTMSPRSDAFDPAPAPPSPRRNSPPPSPRRPASPHMSRSFSKRSSLLPPHTASVLEREGTVVKGKHGKTVNGREDKGYERKLHAYAIRMLAELEDAQKEVSH